MTRNRIYSATLLAAIATAGVASAQEVTPETADTDTPDCAAMISGLETELATENEKRVALREEMATLAAEMPLLVVMSDERFVWLGSSDELAEPIESWFESEEVLEKKQARVEQASLLLGDEDEEACIAALAEENDAEPEG
jgi:hypothetical protein